VLKTIIIVAGGFVFGLLLSSLALVLNIIVNDWDDAPGGGFIMAGALLIGIVVGLFVGIISAFDAPTAGAGLIKAFLRLLIAALVLGGALSALIHSSEHALKAYTAALVLWGLTALILRLRSTHKNHEPTTTN
jgi:hypothetical protein